MENSEAGKGASDATNDLLKNIFGEESPKTLTDVEKEGLKGNVKQIKQQHYKAFERDGNVYLGNLEGRFYQQKNRTVTFSKAGYQIDTTEIDQDGEKHNSIYNAKGERIESNNYNSEDILTGKSTFKFNDDQDIVEMISYDGNGEVTSKSNYLYFAKQKHSLAEYFDKDDKLTMRSEYFYDKNGWRVEMINKNEKGEVTFWAKFKNNIKGHEIETIFLKPDGSVQSTSSMAEYYDSNGDFIHTPNRFKNEEDQYSSKLEKDHHGNWIKKILCYRKLAAFVYLREIEYYDEVFVPVETFSSEHFKLPLLVHNISIEKTTEEDLNKLDLEKMESLTAMEPKEAQWLTDKTPNVENFSYMAYYTLKNNDFPSVILHREQNIETRALLQQLEYYLEAQIVHSVHSVDSNGFSQLEKYTLCFPEHPGYMVHASQIHRVNGDEYVNPPFIDSLQRFGDNTLHISQITVLQPSSASGINESNNMEYTIQMCIENCMLETLPDRPEINMVEVAPDGSFMLQEHPAKDDFEIDDLDVQYGYGFEKFHDELMDRFRNENQGLVLFHGIPGTGKTYYIRHLLREMAISKKIVIYMPPNMVDYLVEPAFMTFLSRTVTTYSTQGKFCVLLIEDAEPLLASRNTTGRIQGVTNLLNMTDGLLNDMLKLQIICTFNVDLKELDAALLRPGRLIARKEFKALGEIEANLLAQSLGIKHHFKAPATLSEIYAMLKNKNTLIHDEY